jgi:RNA polymerase sigma-70 factor (ECF subfamily)
MRADQKPIEQKVALVLRAQAGELAAFGELIALYRRLIMCTISRLIARPEDVEDVAQEIFLRVHTSLHQLREPEAFDIWLYRVTMNGVYDYLRRRPRRPEIRMADLLEEQIDAAQESASRQWLRDQEERRRTIECVDGLLAQLCASDRILMVLRSVEGLSLEELSSVLGIKVGAVKVRLFRARNRLRRVLDPDYGRNAMPLATCPALAQEV